MIAIDVCAGEIWEKKTLEQKQDMEGEYINHRSINQCQRVYPVQSTLEHAVPRITIQTSQ